MSALVWGLEWRLAQSSRRDLAARIVGPLAVALTIATGAVPAVAAASAYTVLFAAFGLFGTALPVSRDGERGIVARVVRAGVSPSSYLIQRAAAGASVAFVELLPASAVAALWLDASSVELLIAWGVLAVSLWIGSLLGVVTAAVSRSRGEAAVLGAILLVLLLHMSGVFSTPASDGLGASLEAASPFGLLHEAFLTMVAGEGMQGGVAAAAWAIVLPVIVYLMAPRLTASLQR